MKKLALAVFALVAFAGLAAFTFQRQNTATAPPVELKWYTWEEAVALNKTKPKKIFVDVYTDWCGWCKKMDKATFNDPTVAAYLTEHFYPVKLNAEQKADILFNGETFKYVETGNGHGVHTLAYSLLDGQLSYPTVVYINEKYERIMISKGYKETADIMKELRFAAEERYNQTTWEQYKAAN